MRPIFIVIFLVFSLSFATLTATGSSMPMPTLTELFQTSSDVLFVEELGETSLATPKTTITKSKFRVLRVWKSSRDSKPGQIVYLCYGTNSKVGYSFDPPKPKAKHFVFVKRVNDCLFQFNGYSSVLGILENDSFKVRTDSIDGEPLVQDAASFDDKISKIASGQPRK